METAWQVFYNERQEPYFFHSTSSETTWEPPPAIVAAYAHAQRARAPPLGVPEPGKLWFR
jgi:hypothetical protein